MVCSRVQDTPLGNLPLATTMESRNTTSWAPSVRRGFSLVDILVSIAVMAVLIGILLPSVSRVRESARRVICQSNMKQVGLGIAMYAEDHGSLIPPSVYGSHANYEQRPTEMMQLHLGGGIADNWESLGWLMLDGHISAEGVFYCPSHAGHHAQEIYDDLWRNLGSEIVGNYNYRPVPDYERDLARMDSRTVLVTDGLRTMSDYNHVSGNNVLSADISVTWYDDEHGFLLSLLPENDEGEFGGAYGAAVVWQMLDDGGPAPGQFDSPGARDDTPLPSRLEGPSTMNNR